MTGGSEMHSNERACLGPWMVPQPLKSLNQDPFPIDVLLEQVPMPAALSGLAYGEDLVDGSKGFRSEDPLLLSLSVSDFSRTLSELDLYIILPLLDTHKLFSSRGIHNESLDRSLHRSHSSTPGYFYLMSLTFSLRGGA